MAAPHPVEEMGVSAWSMWVRMNRHHGVGGTSVRYTQEAGLATAHLGLSRLFAHYRKSATHFAGSHSEGAEGREERMPCLAALSQEWAMMCRI